MLSAVKEGNLETVRQLLIQGFDVNQVDNYGFTPLYIATRAGHVDLVSLLLSYDAAVNQATNVGDTPLNVAVCDGNVDVITLLLSHGAKINQENNYGDTPLNVAACEGNVDVARLLLSHRAAVNQANNHGLTPLYFAAGQGHTQVVRLLLDSDAAVNKADNDGKTPLYRAAEYGHVDVIRLLLSRGADADVNQAGNRGRTQPYVAFRKNHSYSVRLLEACGGIRTTNVDIRKKAFKALDLPGRKAVLSYFFITNKSGKAQVLFECLGPEERLHLIHSIAPEVNPQVKNYVSFASVNLIFYKAASLAEVNLIFYKAARLAEKSIKQRGVTLLPELSNISSPERCEKSTNDFSTTHTKIARLDQDVLSRITQFLFIPAPTQQKKLGCIMSLLGWHKAQVKAEAVDPASKKSGLSTDHAAAAETKTNSEEQKQDGNSSSSRGDREFASSDSPAMRQ